MRASMPADGTICHPRYSPVVTIGLCGTERIVSDPHSVVAPVETLLGWPPGGDEFHLAHLCGPELLNDKVSRGNGGNMYINLNYNSVIVCSDQNMMAL